MSVPKNLMIRAVVDTNTIVSAAISPKGFPRRVYMAWLEGRYMLVTSPPIIAEIARVLNSDQAEGDLEPGDVVSMQVAGGGGLRQCAVAEPHSRPSWPVANVVVTPRRYVKTYVKTGGLRR